MGAFTFGEKVQIFAFMHFIPFILIRISRLLTGRQRTQRCNDRKENNNGCCAAASPLSLREKFCLHSYL
jgi:hypothetical protein